MNSKAVGINIAMYMHQNAIIESLYKKKKFRHLSET